MTHYAHVTLLEGHRSRSRSKTQFDRLVASGERREAKWRGLGLKLEKNGRSVKQKNYTDNAVGA
jgi:hypothetical protein